MEFETQEQAEKCLRKWQARLFLSDWIIVLKLVDSSEMSNAKHAGEIEPSYENQSAVIYMAKANPDDVRNFIAKIVAEKTLVHELLHCKYMEPDITQYEAWYTSMRKHQLLEKMAKSLIMAEYGLSYEWFVNNRGDDDG